jgi:hypothetical protein
MTVAGKHILGDCPNSGHPGDPLQGPQNRDPLGCGGFAKRNAKRDTKRDRVEQLARRMAAEFG